MPRSPRPAALIAAAALAATAAPAVAVPPTITGADPDDLWGAQQTVSYTLTAAAPNELIGYRVDRGATGIAPSPFILVRPDLAEGTHVIEASVNRGREFTIKSFTIDRTAPAAPIVTSPAEGTVLAVGQFLVAGYTCPDAAGCRGDVPAGAPLDTSVPGARTLTVTAADAAGNTATTTRSFTVAPPPPPPPPPSPPPATAAALPPLRLPPPPGAGPARPRTLHPERLRPRLSARLPGRRPTLRWRPRRGATLYNVQVFRVRQNGVVKVLSAFPRRSRYRVPRGRLRGGVGYVWRVWPFMAARRAYATRPLGVSYFTVRRTPPYNRR